MIRLEGVRVVAKVRRRNSLLGNSRWYLDIQCPSEKGCAHRLRTRTDSSWAYEVETLSEGDTIDVVVATGNWIDGVWKAEP